MPAIFAFCVLLTLAESSLQPASLSRGASDELRDPSSCFATSLPHARRVATGVFCGGEPSDEAAFARLRKLGIRTIVSVDGATPRVDLARQFGMRYVHVPIGYDGIHESAQQSLARVARETERPLYIHCHHGRHRGPAAAAIVCLATSDMERRHALQLLEVAGTSPDYGGLWQAVRAYRPLAPCADDPELVEVAELNPAATAMVRIDRAFETLQRCCSADESPLLATTVEDARQQAVLIREEFRELRRLGRGQHDIEVFTAFAVAEQRAEEIAVACAKNQIRDAARRLQALHRSCVECHHQYRD